MKTILLHAYDDTGLEARLQADFDLARAIEGQVTCVHATPFEDYLEVDPWVAARLPEEFSEKMQRLNQMFREQIEARLRVEGISWDWVHVNALPSEALGRFSAVADVAVVSLAGPALLRSDPRPVAARIAISARAPVLAVPEEAEAIRLDAPMIVAWNGTSEAGAAMKAALPLLARASGVVLLEIEERKRAYPRARAARFLARHGLSVEIVERQPIDGSVTAAIEKAAAEIGAGVIVMGAYGHSRLRELVLGGVTHELVGRSAVPLLLAH